MNLLFNHFIVDSIKDVTGKSIICNPTVVTREDFEFFLKLYHTLLKREKEGDLTQSYDKNPYTNRKFENQRTTHTNATKNFDYTTIADRLRTVSWSNK